MPKRISNVVSRINKLGDIDPVSKRSLIRIALLLDQAIESRGLNNVGRAKARRRAQVLNKSRLRAPTNISTETFPKGVRIAWDAVDMPQLDFYELVYLEEGDEFSLSASPKKKTMFSTSIILGDLAIGDMDFAIRSVSRTGEVSAFTPPQTVTIADTSASGTTLYPVFLVPDNSVTYRAIRGGNLNHYVQNIGISVGASQTVTVGFSVARTDGESGDTSEADVPIAIEIWRDAVGHHGVMVDGFYLYGTTGTGATDTSTGYAGFAIDDECPVGDHTFYMIVKTPEFAAANVPKVRNLAISSFVSTNV